MRKLLLIGAMIAALLLVGCDGDEKEAEEVAPKEVEVIRMVGSDAETTTSGSDSDSEAESVDEDGAANEWMVTTDRVRVRATPSLDGEIYKVLDAGCRVEQIGREDEWSEVILDGGTYYISGDYLKSDTESQDTSESDKMAESVGTAEVSDASEAVGTAETSGTEESGSAQASVVATPVAHSNTGGGKLIVIDAGHQRKGNSEKEPIGPGATEMKAKVTGGTSGKTTGLAEYELNLQVALKLDAELKARGYSTIMVRTSNDVNMSNAERAQVANSANADAFIRIHANGSENSSVNGAMTICPTAANKYCPGIYASSKALSTCVMDALVAATGATREKVWETDTMSGINWCQVPVTIVEMGYMSNPEEDAKMATDAYQTLLAQGIANGIDNYMNQ